MKSVYIVPNMIKARAADVACRVTEYFLNCGFKVYCDNEIRNICPTITPERVSFLDANSAAAACDFIAVIGGDGSLLRTAPLAAKHKKPILGINNGKLGFMTEIDASDLERIKRIPKGDYVLEKRIMLDVTVRDKKGKQMLKTTVLNDAVVTKGTFSRLVDIEIQVDKKSIMEFRGDGLIISTPTGSTGYSLSAGGAIIEPSAHCIAVTPICPHALSVKSFVLASEHTVEVPEKTPEQSRFLSLDGSDMIELKSGETIEVKKSRMHLSVMRITDTSFYQRINAKLVSGGV